MTPLPCFGACWRTASAAHPQKRFAHFFKAAEAAIETVMGYREDLDAGQVSGLRLGLGGLRPPNSNSDSEPL